MKKGTSFYLVSAGGNSSSMFSEKPKSKREHSKNGDN